MRKSLVATAIVLSAVYFWNASWTVAPPAAQDIRIIAHRGVHQTYDRVGLDNDTCTATRIFPPEHRYLENTIASMQAAFAAGADIVELDVHPTTDGRFAVMHDWTVDCRTEASGTVRSHSMASLKRMDIGYGYTADGGATFPFRGLGVGLMPALDEVLAAMPDRRFLVNFKSKEVREGDMLADLLAAHPDWHGAVWGVYGGDAPTLQAKRRVPDIAAWTRRGLVSCLGQYVLYGWTGAVPSPCRDTTIMVPINVAPFLWGWPNRFQQRMAHVGSEIILIGPYKFGDPGTAGIDDVAMLSEIPERFSGFVWTNRVEHIGPALRR